MIADKKQFNPWKYEDELEHFPSVMEWWASIAFLKTVEDGKKWHFKISFAEWFDKKYNIIGSVFNSSLQNEETKKHYLYTSRNDENKLECAKDKFHVNYGDSYIKGAYPNYDIHLKDKENNIQMDLKLKAEAYPHWVAQEVTNGWLPMGLGFFRYGFIPKCKTQGKLMINDKKYQVDGLSYFEHVWGDFSYTNPLSNFKQIGKTISTYVKLVEWWLINNKICIPNSISFTTENNPMGYDWAWALLDNGWMIFYGNILFWIMSGPAAGTIILSKDGKHYEEFFNINFRYNEIKYSKIYDFFYPTDLEITAKKGREIIHLRFKMTHDAREYESRFYDGKYWVGFVICEASGMTEGYYSDGEKRIKLNGVCRIEPQRQISIFGHNSLKIDFLKPPNGVGVSFDLESHYLQKKIFAKIQFMPKLKLKIKLDRIPKSKINKPKHHHL